LNQEQTMSDLHNTNEPDRGRDERLGTADIVGEPGAEKRTFDMAEERVLHRNEESDFVDEMAPLFSTQEADVLQRRWTSIQSGFVDEPRRAVQQADSMVADAMKRLADMFADERAGLERQWDRGGDVSTEDLRLALQRYRSFFTRLLSV
jgi:hypothetical protein